MKKSLFLLLTLLSCATYTTTQQHVLADYRENLALYRTHFPKTVDQRFKYDAEKDTKSNKKYNFDASHDITNQLQELLSDLKSFYAMTPLVAGYTIQAYFGSDRQLAFQIQEQIIAQYAQIPVEIQYRQPNFSVRIGRFLEQIEAYQLYFMIKKDFPQAIIRPVEFENQSNALSPLKAPELSQQSDEQDYPTQVRDSLEKE